MRADGRDRMSVRKREIVRERDMVREREMDSGQGDGYITNSFGPVASRWAL